MNALQSLALATAGQAATAADRWNAALATFRAADAAFDAIMDRVDAAAGPELAAIYAEADPLIKARDAAYDALLATPPADMAALALKMLLHSRECDDHRVGFDDPNHRLDECYAVLAAQGASQFYRDVLGLAALAA